MGNQSISIALCSFNGARFIEAQLNSYASQERQPDELVICDDGSKDNTIEIIHQFAKKVSFPVHLILNRNQLGVVKNFEKAIDHCTGDLILLSDQDDVWYPNKLKLIERIFLEFKDIGAVFSDADIVDENLIPLGYRLFESNNLSPNHLTPKKQKLLMNYRAFEVLMNNKVVTGATLAFRSKYRKFFMPIPSEWMHDHWIALNISAFANLMVIKEPLIMYRQHGNNQIGGKRQKLSDLINKAKKNGREYYNQELIKFLLLYINIFKHCNYAIKGLEMKKIVNKIDHLRICSSLSPNIWYRLPIILQQIINLNYFYYSGGWQRIVTDITYYR